MMVVTSNSLFSFSSLFLAFCITCCQSKDHVTNRLENDVSMMLRQIQLFDKDYKSDKKAIYFYDSVKWTNKQSGKRILFGLSSIPDLDVLIGENLLLEKDFSKDMYFHNFLDYGNDTLKVILDHAYPCGEEACGIIYEYKI